MFTLTSKLEKLEIQNRSIDTTQKKGRWSSTHRSAKFLTDVCTVRQVQFCADTLSVNESTTITTIFLDSPEDPQKCHYSKVFKNII